MSESTVLPHKMSHDELNHMNRMLTRHGFGPQEQGVTVDWDGLDATLLAHYRAKLSLVESAAAPAKSRKRYAGKKKKTKKKAAAKTD